MSYLIYNNFNKGITNIPILNLNNYLVSIDLLLTSKY